MLREDKTNGFFKDGNGSGHAAERQQQEQQQVNGRAASVIRGEDAAQIALWLVEENCSELFLDQFGLPYAEIDIGEHLEILSLKSSRFRN